MESRRRARRDDWQNYTPAGVPITHPDKVWWPDEAITKLDVIRYYAGVEVVRYVVGGSRRTLLALVNLGCIAMHLMNCRRGARDRPDWLAFDLDPGSGQFADAAQAGLVLREILDDVELRSYPKTSGGRGLHILVPLRPGPSQVEVRDFAMHVGRLMAARAPRLERGRPVPHPVPPRHPLECVNDANDHLLGCWMTLTRPSASIHAPFTCPTSSIPCLRSWAISS
jgi:DNA primase